MMPSLAPHTETAVRSASMGLALAGSARRQRPTQAVDALRELEFDRETGKISDADYEPLKARYTEQALVAMRAGDMPVCERCGPCAEPDAEFCSNCGSALVG